MEKEVRKDIERHIEYLDAITSVTQVPNNTLVIATSNNKQWPELEKGQIFSYVYTFGDERYKVNLVDERLLYSSLFAWRDLELTRLFQGDNETVIDDSYGKLALAKKENYINTLKVAKALLNKKVYYIGELYDEINKIIDYPSFKLLTPRNKENALSEEFFTEEYVPLINSSHNRLNRTTGNLDIRDYPKDIVDFVGEDSIKNPQKVLRKYYKKK